MRRWGRVTIGGAWIFYWRRFGFTLKVREGFSCGVYWIPRSKHKAPALRVVKEDSR